jgi:hypothetical protein
MKGRSGTILLGIITVLILIVNSLQAGSVLKPTIDPSPPASMIRAQRYESLPGLIARTETARRAITMNAAKTGLDS